MVFLKCNILKLSILIYYFLKYTFNSNLEKRLNHLTLPLYILVYTHLHAVIPRYITRNRNWSTNEIVLRFYTLTRHGVQYSVHGNLILACSYAVPHIVHHYEIWLVPYAFLVNFCDNANTFSLLITFFRPPPLFHMHDKMYIVQYYNVILGTENTRTPQ